MTTDMSRYLDLFLQEAQEHVQSAAHELARFTRGPRERAPLDALFRHFHSIKGMAASMGFTSIASLSHAMEDLLDRLREAPGRADAECLATLVDAVDDLADRIAGCGGGTAVEVLPDPAQLVDRLRSRIAALTEEEKEEAEAPAEVDRPDAPPASTPDLGAEVPSADRVTDATETTWSCSMRVDIDADMPGPRAVVTLRRLSSLGRVEHLAPARDVIASGRFDGVVAFDLITQAAESEIRARVEDLAWIRAFRCDPVAVPAAGAASPADQPADPVPTLPATLRVPTGALDRLLDATSELIARRGLLREALKGSENPEALRALDRLSQSIESLRDHVMTLRLLPFEHIVPRLQRALRDLTRATGREAALEVTGADVALDRSVLEEIIDPLMHVLRNAVDHGIGTAAERRRRGKPAVGRIGIHVERRSDRILIVVEDDGFGMNVAAIRRTALEGGYVSPADLSRMTEEQCLMLTTIPGFSTAGSVTHVSGRGVGMDVVRTRVESLQGQMSIRSRSGRGTRIEWSLPPSVAVVDAFLVRCRDEVIALPASSVRGVSRVAREEIRSSHTGEYIAGGGRGPEAVFLPLVSLRRLLRVPHDAPPHGPGTDDRAPLPVITCEVHGTRTALAVEEVLGRMEMVVKPLGVPLEQMRAYSGAALMDDGRVALVLDLAGAIESA